MNGLKEIKSWQDEQAKKELLKRGLKIEDYRWPGDPEPVKEDRPAENRVGC